MPGDPRSVQLRNAPTTDCLDIYCPTEALAPGHFVVLTFMSYIMFGSRTFCCLDIYVLHNLWLQDILLSWHVWPTESLAPGHFVVLTCMSYRIFGSRTFCCVDMYVLHNLWLQDILLSWHLILCPTESLAPGHFVVFTLMSYRIFGSRTFCCLDMYVLQNLWLQDILLSWHLCPTESLAPGHFVVLTFMSYRSFGSRTFCPIRFSENVHQASCWLLPV